jgi:hypothetical protein
MHVRQSSTPFVKTILAQCAALLHLFRSSLVEIDLLFGIESEIFAHPALCEAWPVQLVMLCVAMHVTTCVL